MTGVNPQGPPTSASLGEDRSDVSAPSPGAHSSGDWSAPSGGAADKDLFEKSVTAAIVAACSAFIFWQLQPDLILSDTTPTGGDMGAHVWGPHFLRDELLPRFRLSGWTPDWYGGFPAFQFYMVVPALAIVALDVGLQPIIAAVVLLSMLGATIVVRERNMPVLSRRLLIATVVVAPLLISLPYNVAFKLIAVSGVVFFPVGAWALGHLAGLKFPGPAIMSVASLAFAFDRSFNIYGGNIASTLAGEFAASISLTLSLVALGFVIKGTRTGKHKAWAGVFIAFTGLSHLLPAFFLLTAVFIVMVFRVLAGKIQSVQWLAVAGTLSALISAFWVLPFFARTSFLNDMGWERINIIHSPLITRSNLNPADTLSDYPPFAVMLIIAGVGLILSIVRRVELGWFLAFSAAVMALAFVFFPDGRLWNARILPFYYLSVVLLAGVGVHLVIRELAQTSWILRGSLFSASVILLAPASIRNSVIFPEPAPAGEATDWALYASEAGGYVLRILGIFFVIATVGVSLATVLSKLLDRWLVVGSLVALAVLLASPARDLLGDRLESFDLVIWATVFAVAAAVVGVTVVALVLRVPMNIPLDPRSSAMAGGAIIATTSVLILLGIALNSVGGVSEDQPGELAWGVGPLEISSRDTSFVPGWATWNFSGLEGRGINPNANGDVGQGGWEEYQLVQRTMAGVGEEIGCGRSMWEFAPELNRYGTTMAMMLLPTWTDGCIGSQEGLFFEATPSVPYHFLLQSDLSAPARAVGDTGSVGGPSRAMRDLPYQNFDINRGVERLQELGVRYYMAFSPQSIIAARSHPELREVAEASPWVIFETEANLVEPLGFTPVVVDGISDAQDEWLDVGVEWFGDVDSVRPASSGPEGWRRVSSDIIERYEAEGTRLAGSIAPDAAPLTTLLPEVEVTETVEVSDVVTDVDLISFSVDQIGTPVLVRSSFFPNWSAEGAEGPFRVAPNFMVVVPTDTEVVLSFQHTAVDWAAIGLTGLGLIVLFFVARDQLPRFLKPEFS